MILNFHKSLIRFFNAFAFKFILIFNFEVVIHNRHPSTPTTEIDIAIDNKGF